MSRWNRPANVSGHDKRAGVDSGTFGLLAACAVVLVNDLAERSGFEVEITLDGESSGSPASFECDSVLYNAL